MYVLIQLPMEFSEVPGMLSSQLLLIPPLIYSWRTLTHWKSRTRENRELRAIVNKLAFFQFWASQADRNRHNNSEIKSFVHKTFSKMWSRHSQKSVKSTKCQIYGPDLSKCERDTNTNSGTLSTLKVSAVEDEGSAVSSCHENRGIEHSFQYSIVYGIYYFEIQQFSYFESGFFRFFDLAPAGGLLD